MPMLGQVIFFFLKIYLSKTVKYILYIFCCRLNFPTTKTSLQNIFFHNRPLGYYSNWDKRSIFLFVYSLATTLSHSEFFFEWAVHTVWRQKRQLIPRTELLFINVTTAEKNQIVPYFSCGVYGVASQTGGLMPQEEEQLVWPRSSPAVAALDSDVVFLWLPM